MKFKEQPRACAKTMFTNIDPTVAAIHKVYRAKLDDIVKEEHAQQPSFDPSRLVSTDDIHK
jgi:predicted secreted Zn-dependent protease